LLRLISFILAFTTLAATVVSAQREQLPQRAAVKTAGGALFIWNQPGNNFTLEILSKDVSPNNSSKDVYFKADGVVVQIQCAAINQFISGSIRPDGRAILQAHRDWESQYAEITFGKLSVQTSELDLKSGRETLYWKFDVPEKFKDQWKTRLYLTTINGDYVIVLNGIAKRSAEEDQVKRFLLETMATLKVSDKAFDLPKNPGGNRPN